MPHSFLIADRNQISLRITFLLLAPIWQLPSASMRSMRLKRLEPLICSSMALLRNHLARFMHRCSKMKLAMVMFARVLKIFRSYGITLNQSSRSSLARRQILLHRLTSIILWKPLRVSCPVSLRYQRPSLAMFFSALQLLLGLERPSRRPHWPASMSSRNLPISLTSLWTRRCLRPLQVVCELYICHPFALTYDR